MQEQSQARYALGLMINREELVEYVTMGGQVAATGFFPAGLADGLNSNVRANENYGTWYTGTNTESEENPIYFYTNPNVIKPNIQNLAILSTGDVIWNYVTIAE